MSTSTHDELWSARQRLVDDLLAELREQHADVKLIETHISWVLLGSDVYKIKKPVRLPFLDFTSLESREGACRTELRINRRLAPHTYRDVAPIRRRADGRFTFAKGSGAVVEWAVHMRRLDETRRADVLVERGELGVTQVDALAQAIAAFHAGSPSGPRIARHGTPEVIERNVTDNFSALSQISPELFSADALNEVRRWQLDLVRGQRILFEQRMLDGAIRDGHGDLRLEHVFVQPEGFEVIDGIEFDDRYRLADVCADVAFLAMDLARLGRVDLAERFVAIYARAANDFDLYRVLDFYESYRACVRAKISAVSDAWSARMDARRYLLLAQAVRRRSMIDPVLIVVAGGIASGKSTIAERLAVELSAPIIDADRTRKHMLGLAPTAHAAAGPWQGAYEPTLSVRVYAELLRRARAVLESGRPAILDASFRTVEARALARTLASKVGVPFRLVECVAPLSVCRARLRARRPEETVSDATPDILEAFARGWEPIVELNANELVRVETTDALRENIRRIKLAIETWPRGLVQ